MIIAGIQALSLIDYPEKPCSIIFTQGCSFRCSYCHNSELLPFSEIGEHSRDNVIAFLKERQSIIDAVCITGGEPTMQRGLIDFMRILKGCGFAIKLDTNGSFPEVIASVMREKLADYIAMDIKAPWEKYLEVIKIGTLKTIEACKRTFFLIQESGSDHEFRTTLLPGVHSEEDLFQIAEYLKNGERYFIQQTSLSKTLEPLDTKQNMDAKGLVEGLKKRFPLLAIESR